MVAKERFRKLITKCEIFLVKKLVTKVYFLAIFDFRIFSSPQKVFLRKSPEIWKLISVFSFIALKKVASDAINILQSNNETKILNFKNIISETTWSKLNFSVNFHNFFVLPKKQQENWKRRQKSSKKLFICHFPSLPFMLDTRKHFEAFFSFCENWSRPLIQLVMKRIESE